MTPSADDDAHSVERIRAGGNARAQAIGDLYRRYANRVLGHFVRQRVPRDQAADLVQDVFVNVVRRCEEFRGDARFATWMWTIARNVLIDHYRKLGRTPLQDEIPDDDAGLDSLPAAEEQPRELRDCVQRAYSDFASAHAERAETLALVAFEGWSVEEVAAFLGRTPGAAREYLSQCRKRLRPFLERCRELLLG